MFELDDTTMPKRPKPKAGDLSGAWILALGLLLSQGPLHLKYRPMFHRLIYNTSDRPSIVDRSLSEGEYLRLSELSSTKRYVRGDLIEGCLSAVGVTLSVLVSVLFWRRSPMYAFMNLWMSVLWGLHAILFAAYIRLNSSNLFDPPNSIIPWSDFDSYIAASDRFSNGTHVGFVILGLPLIWFVHSRLAKFQKSSDPGTAQAPNPE